MRAVGSLTRWKISIVGVGARQPIPRVKRTQYITDSTSLGVGFLMKPKLDYIFRVVGL